MSVLAFGEASRGDGPAAPGRRPRWPRHRDPRLRRVPAPHPGVLRAGRQPDAGAGRDRQRRARHDRDARRRPASLDGPGRLVGHRRGPLRRPGGRARSGWPPAPADRGQPGLPRRLPRVRARRHASGVARLAGPARPRSRTVGSLTLATVAGLAVVGLAVYVGAPAAAASVAHPGPRPPHPAVARHMRSRPLRTAIAALVAGVVLLSGLAVGDRAGRGAEPPGRGSSSSRCPRSPGATSTRGTPPTSTACSTVRRWPRSRCATSCGPPPRPTATPRSSAGTRARGVGPERPGARARRGLLRRAGGVGVPTEHGRRSPAAAW